MIRYILLFVFAVTDVLFTGKAFSQATIPFAFTSEEDNRLIRENDSFKYYVATGDTTNVVCIDEENAYYKLLAKDGKLIAEGGFVTETDKYLQQGKWMEHYSNGKVKLAGYYARGKAVGTWQEYYSNGKLKTVSNYAAIDDEHGYRATCLSGTYQEYYQNGKIKLNGLYAATASRANDTMEVDDPVTGEKKQVITHHASYRAEKIGHWEHYDESGEQEKKED